MMFRLLAVALWLWPTLSVAQTAEVRPDELSLTVTLDDPNQQPLAREMVLITIRGVYRRHITRETLVQPDLAGFSWAQLGPDNWSEERINGEKVKVFTRRMALYPDEAGDLEIGAFTHGLTLTDEADDWFTHEVQSPPVSLSVAPVAVETDWWFPVRGLQIADRWSNAPDQLAVGEGVLRIVQLEALGVTPEMVPPMPELTSPSAMIFPHPEKRLVELTPDGPVTHAFWRWTIRPSNDHSAIVEPLSFDYFDTSTREHRSVTISAQRVAYGGVTPAESNATNGQIPSPARLPGWPVGLLALAVFISALAMTLPGRKLDRQALFRHVPMLDPDVRRMRRAARAGDLIGVRRTVALLMRRDGAGPTQERVLRDLDRACCDPKAKKPDLRQVVSEFLRIHSVARS